MRYWIGAAFFLYAAYFVFGIVAQRKRVGEARAALERHGPIAEKPLDPKSMAAFGEMMAPIVQGALLFLGAKICFAYYVLDAGRFVSLFDLAGALTLLAAYGTWVSVKTKCRMPNVAVEASQATIVTTALSSACRISQSLRIATVDSEAVGIDAHVAAKASMSRRERHVFGLE